MPFEDRWLRGGAERRARLSLPGGVRRETGFAVRSEAAADMDPRQQAVFLDLTGQPFPGFTVIETMTT
jgi:hypothetical protein